MTSLVAKAKISAHETTFLHPLTLSTAALALITVSKPSPARERLSGLSFSDFLEASIIEASQPCRKNTTTFFVMIGKKKTHIAKLNKEKRNTTLICKLSLEEGNEPGQNSRGRKA